MQDMDTMQQSITSPAQAHDTPKKSTEEGNLRLHLKPSETDTKNNNMKQSKESHPNFIDPKNESNQNNETMTELPNIENSSQVIHNKASDKTEENEPKIKEEYRKIKEEYEDGRDVEMMEIAKVVDRETTDDIEMKYVCPICDAALFSQHDFTLHIRLHNNNSSDTLSNLHCAKGFSCKICSKVLSSSSSLDRHVLVHSGERPFKCRICGVAFTTNGNMHRHMRTHNLESSAPSNRGDDSDVSSDGGSSSHGSRRSPNSSPSTVNKTRKRKVSDITLETADAAQSLSPSLNSFETACNKRKVSASSFSSAIDIPNSIVRRRTKSMTDTNKESLRQCPVCERENFATVNALETHLEENHPDYKAKCHICDLIFKNHRALNLHRFMTHHEIEDTTLNFSAKSKHNKTAQQGVNSVLGFRDLTFVDFSSEKFPHIARAVCEKSLHKASSAFHKFQCEKCLRAFPCGSALKIHCKACYSGVEYTTDEFSSSDCDTPTDLSKRRREEEPHFRSRILSDAESEEEQKREDFFAGLDLRNKSALTPDKIPFSDIKQDERFDNDSYFDVTQNAKFENGKDLADIQSIISVTSATGFMQDLSKSPQPQISDLTPPDSALKLSVVDSGGCEEEQQDCFAAEFRKMKLKGEFPCRLCVLVFPNLRALKGHNRVHLMSSSGIFRCNMCPYSNTDKAVVVRHMRTHNGDRPYECSLCNYAFTTKANCERHLRNRHSKLTREEVRKSIIYHPSEDPINDPEIQGKFSAREDVKRSLVFGNNLSSDDLQDEESLMSRNSLNDKISSQTNLCNERMTGTGSSYEKNDVDEEHIKKEHPLDIKNSNFTHLAQTVSSKDSPNTIRQMRPWEMHEASTMTGIKNVEETDSNEFKNVEAVKTDDLVHEASQTILRNDKIMCTNKNISNTHQTMIANSQIIHSIGSIPVQPFIKHLGQTFKDDANCDDSEDVTPLDLSMDALDLSKKKEEFPVKEGYTNNSYSFSSHSESEEEDDNNEPQDLSKKKVFSDNDKKQIVYSNFSPNSQSNSDFCHTNNFAKQLYNNNNNNNNNVSAIASPHRQSPTLTPKVDVSAGIYASNPHLTSLFMNNNNNFAFPGQNAFRLPPYFLPSPHHPLFHPTNIQDFSEMKERLQKELIRGLQLTSGGTMLDPLTVAASADHMQAFHQHTLAEIARGNPDIKVSFSDSNMNSDDFSLTGSSVSKEANDKHITFNSLSKSSNKESQQSKGNKDRESTSVKMVIKNGVLMPKQKQRRYRTERPFACEHCSARFTLRSNMERHIKQQHPQFWSQRQRNSNGNVGPGRRSYAAAITSITNQTQLNTPHSQESKCSSDGFDQGSATPEKLLSTSSFEGTGNERIPKRERDESNNIELLQKTKEICSVIGNSDCVNKAYISDEVKLAIAQQLKSKLNNPLSNREENNKKREIRCERGEADEEDDENDGLVIDEEKDVSGNTEMTNDEITDIKSERTESKDEAVVDLASVSRLLDNATTQNRAFQQYFKGTQDGEDEGGDFVRGEGSEEEEEGLVAGSNSEGNNSGSDENRSESDTILPKEKKKSAYSLAPNRVSCPYCLRKFPWSSSLRRHILTHTGQKPYKCPHCPLLFTTKSNCDRHLLRKHGGHSTSNTNSNNTNETPTNSNPTTLTLSYTMRNVPERPYKCNFCPSSTFSTQSNLKKHMATKHCTGSSPTSPACSASKCVTSGDEFGPTSNVDGRCGTEDCISEDNEEKISQENGEILEKNDSQTHNQSAVDTRVTLPVHGSSSDLFVPKPLSSSENHGSSVGSSADLPFKCHLCEGSYPERQEALDHIREIHPSEYKLLMSKGALETANSEDNNNLNHTAGSQDDGNGDENLEQLRGKFPDYANRKVMCAFCLRRFWSAEDLRRHMRTHTGERPFSCDICRRRFTLKHSMLRHRKKHNTSSVSASTEDISVVSGDEDAGLISLTVPRNSDFINKTTKLSIKMTNHNNNNIAPTKCLGSGYNWESGKHDLALSAAQILSSKFSGDRKDDGSGGTGSEEDTDLIGNLLGIQDRSIIDKVLLSKSADDAAKLLGMMNGSH